MGCSSSIEIYEPRAFEGRTVVWFLGGGPGAPKQGVAQFLMERYKVKYLSAVDLIHFEESTSSPESAEIKKAIEERQEFSSGLVMRVLKKVLNLYGPRKYLIDFFPRNEADLTEFQGVCRKYREVELQGYLQLHLQEAQMKESGIKAMREMKKEESLENIEKEVRTVIETYRGKSKPILEYYQQRGKLIMAPYTNSDINLMLDSVGRSLSKNDISPVTMVPFHFIDGNDQEEVYKFSIRIARAYGLRYWAVQQLIAEAKQKPQVESSLAGKKAEDMESPFLVDLIFKKLEKFNYKGKYLISGFPRHEEDIKNLKVKFRSEIDMATYTACLHTPTTQKEKQAFEKIHTYFQTIEEIPSALVQSSEQAYGQVAAQIGKVVPVEKLERKAKVILMPRYQNEGQEYYSKMGEWAEVVDFDELMRKEIKADVLSSDLINSCMTLGRTIPAFIAGSLVVSRVEAAQTSRSVVVVGFPQNGEQLKMLLAKSNGISVLGGVYTELKKKSDGKADIRLKEYQQLQKLLSYACEKFFKVSEKTTYQQLKAFVETL